MQNYGNPTIYVNKKYLNIKFDNNFRLSLTNANNHYLVFDVYSTINPRHPETHLGWASFNMFEDSCFDLSFDFQNLIKANGKLKPIKKWINNKITDELLYPAFLHIFLMQKDNDSIIYEKKMVIFYDSTLLSHKICQLNSFTIFNPDTRYNIDNFGGFNKFLFVCDKNSKNANYLLFKIAYSFLLLNYRNCEILHKESYNEINNSFNSNSIYIFDTNLPDCKSLIDTVMLTEDNEKTFEIILKLLFFNLYIDQNFLHSLQYFNVSDIFVVDNIYNNFDFMAQINRNTLLYNKQNIILVSLCSANLYKNCKIVENDILIINYININQLFTLQMNKNYNIHCYGEIANMLLN